ncbi:MAG TPA: 30S ribosome-binding factor RbfA [Methylomirabilota bacterium]|jgi:ribosome-binding factor A|nr:30S ribosome-binding factor RbfA [Methylomirabilota bacterium]
MSRLQRVNQLIREEISHLVQRELKDPRLGFVTVTEVDVAKDLRTAKVYVSVLGSEAELRATLAALESARGFMRNWLAPRLRLRAIPHLTFHPDRSMAHAAHIQTVLEELRTEGRAPDDSDPEPGAQAVSPPAASRPTSPDAR